jgi:MFS family permease
MFRLGAQTPLYFMVGPLSYILEDIPAGSKASWLVVSYTLASAVPVPFAGYIQDIVGRRYFTLCSSLTCVIGCVIMGTAHTFGQFIVGSTIAGAGAGIAELGAIAG